MRTEQDLRTELERYVGIMSRCDHVRTLEWLLDMIGLASEELNWLIHCGK